MTISLDEPRASTPVVKATAIGETFVGALVRQHQRDVLKEGQPVVNDKGKHRQELVLTLVAMPGTTAPAGIGQEVGVPAPGDVVRLILRGGAFGQWIEAKRAHGTLNVGDVVARTTDHAQAYNAQGAPSGPRLSTMAEVHSLPRAQSVGIYGPITLRRPGPGEVAWVEAAEQAYHATQPRTELESAFSTSGNSMPATSGVGIDEVPF